MQNAWDELKMHVKFGCKASWEETVWEIQVAEEWLS
jgi:hypothetical protein